MLLKTPLCNFGWKAPDFKLLSFDGTLHNRDSLIGPKGFLLAFICNHCPYVKAIAKNLALDSLKLEQYGIKTVAIMPNDYLSYPADNPKKMREFARKNDFHFPYLIDEKQTIAKAYKAVCTPDFFGFNADLELQYRGRLDNLIMGKGDDRVPELLNAMKMIADTNVGPKEQINSMGCSIKWN